MKWPSRKEVACRRGELSVPDRLVGGEDHDAPAGPCDTKGVAGESHLLDEADAIDGTGDDYGGHAGVVERGQMVTDLGHDEGDGRPIVSSQGSPHHRAPGLDRANRAAGPGGDLHQPGVAGLSHHERAHD